MTSIPTNENGVYFCNHYHCTVCDIEWESSWDSMCDDRCPGCNTAISPCASDELSPMRVTQQERNTILAALRYYQKQGLGDPQMRPVDIHDIATDGDCDTSLNDAGIDVLCERINSEIPG